MSITVKDNMSPRIQKFLKDLKNVMPDAYTVWMKNTPTDSGGAKRKTSLTGNTIHANYPYAEALDSGSSKKSPEGMSKPTSDFISRRLKSLGK